MTDADSALESARSLFAHNEFANVPGSYIGVYLELACRGPLTPAELAATETLSGVSKRRIYELLDEMRADGKVRRVSQSKHTLTDDQQPGDLHS